MVLPPDRLFVGVHSKGFRCQASHQEQWGRVSLVGLFMFFSSIVVGFLLVRGLAKGLSVEKHGGGEGLRPGEMVATYVPEAQDRVPRFWELVWNGSEHLHWHGVRFRFRAPQRTLSAAGQLLEAVSKRVQLELLADPEGMLQRSNPTMALISSGGRRGGWWRRWGGSVLEQVEVQEELPGGTLQMKLSGELNYVFTPEDKAGRVCVAFDKPLGEYNRHGPGQVLGSSLGIGDDERKDIPDNSEKPPDWCPEPKRRHGEPCIWGSGVVRAVVMRPAFFFIRFFPSSARCYVRTTGAGVLLPTLTLLDNVTLRANYVAEQEGMYQFWILCTSVAHGQRRPWPSGSRFKPWLHHYLTRWSPYTLTVEADRGAPPRGCSPCPSHPLGMQVGGQWVRRAVLECLCGRKGLGAVEEWVVDDYVWAPRHCLIPFVGREEVGRRLRGRAVAVAGDGSMRGHFVDLVNWLNGVGSHVLQDQGGYEMNTDTHVSSWDGHVAGFNGFPLTRDVDVIDPNPWAAQGFFLQYFEVEGEESWGSFVDRLKEGFASPNGTSSSSLQPPDRERRDFDSLIFNYASWDGLPARGPDPYPLSVEAGTAVRNILRRLRCSGGKGEGEACEKAFEGHIVYRTGTGRFDETNFCLRQNESAPLTFGRSCSVNSAVLQTLTNCSTLAGDMGVKLLHAFDIAFSRPDRSIDSRLFFPRKCSVDQRVCSGREERNPRECCYPPNLFPHVVSLTLTNMLVHTLLGDDALGVRHEFASIKDEELKGDPAELRR